MNTIISEAMQRIEAAGGVSLALSGMTVVFFGLFSLFVCLLILKKFIIILEEKKDQKKISSTDKIQKSVEMDEIAVVIGLALHLFKHRKKREITQKRAVSQWKESHRIRSLNRL